MRPDPRLIRAVAGYLPTWLAVATVGAWYTGFVRWFQPGPGLALAGAALGLACLALWPVLLIRDPGFQHRLPHLVSRVGSGEFARLFQLEQDLRALGGQAYAERLHTLRDRFDLASRLLIRRIHHGELRFGQYLSLSERLLSRALDDTARALGLLRGLPQDETGYQATDAAGQQKLTQAAGLLNRNDIFSQALAELSDALNSHRQRGADSQPQTRAALEKLRALESGPGVPAPEPPGPGARHP